MSFIELLELVQRKLVGFILTQLQRGIFWVFFEANDCH